MEEQPKTNDSMEEETPKEENENSNEKNGEERRSIDNAKKEAKTPEETVKIEMEEENDAVKSNGSEKRKEEEIKTSEDGINSSKSNDMTSNDADSSENEDSKGTEIEVIEETPSRIKGLEYEEETPPPPTNRGLFVKRFANFRQNIHASQTLVRVRSAAANASSVAVEVAAKTYHEVRQRQENRQRRQQEDMDVISSSSYSSESSAEIAGGEPAPPPTPFQGRYTNTATPDSKHLTQSQTALILNSPSPAKTILSTLSPGHYVLLLGPGMMGVNLKQCFHPKYGTYVDFLVTDGAADKSGIVVVGDGLIRVGDVDVSRGTIHEVPVIIANAKRPAVIVLTREFDVGRVLDLAIGVCLKVMEDARSTECVATKPITTSSPAPQDTADNDSDDDTRALCANQPINWTTFSLSPQTRETLLLYAKKRNNEQPSFSALSKALHHPPFQSILQRAFRECCRDARRIPFLRNHYSNEDEFDDSCSKLFFGFYLEIAGFYRIKDVTPPSTEMRLLRKMAHRLYQHKDHLIRSCVVSNQHIPLLYKSVQPFHDNDDTEDDENYYDTLRECIFHHIQTNLEIALSRSRFVRFLISNECARMRAYLRGTATPCPELTLSTIFHAAALPDASSKNIFLYLLLHAVCWEKNDPEREEEQEEPRSSNFLLTRTSRDVENYGPAGICCAVAIERASDDPLLMKSLWETFLCPKLGMLHSITFSNPCRVALQDARNAFTLFFESDTTQNSKELRTILLKLKRELIFDYATFLFLKWKEDGFYETFCSEIVDEEMPKLARGCIARLLRNTHLPSSVSIHKPNYVQGDDDLNHEKDDDEYRVQINGDAKDTRNIDSNHSTAITGNPQKDESIHNADLAIIFGSSDASNDNTVTMKRFATVPLYEDGHEQNNRMNPFDIPSTLEHYAVVPPRRERTFRDEFRVSNDGWEISLINFVIPSSSSSSMTAQNECIYGVSLILCESNEVEDGLSDDEIILHLNNSKHALSECTAETSASDDTPTSDQNTNTSLDLPPEIRKLLREQPWSDTKRQGGNTVGIAFVSARNVIPAMRAALTMLLECYTTDKANSNELVLATAFADLLGMFSDPDQNYDAFLIQILSPFVKRANDPWINRPLTDQATEFEGVSGLQLIQSLPPISLALTILTALLEQKIVFSSSRRSLLLSACTAVTRLLSPLQYSHLMVPFVPTVLAEDLVHYPAPFLIGIVPAEGEEEDAFIDLPADVTVVDLDRGVVALALSTEGSESQEGALKSQLLNLANGLGAVVGRVLFRYAWNCDCPWSYYPKPENSKACNDLFPMLQSIFRQFVDELLQGTSSCCYWIEENMPTDEKSNNESCTVLFDEDRFFHIKNVRAQFRKRSALALSLDEHDLILETFLRSQGMNIFITSCPKQSMIYW